MIVRPHFVAGRVRSGCVSDPHYTDLSWQTASSILQFSLPPCFTFPQALSIAIFSCLLREIWTGRIKLLCCYLTWMERKDLISLGIKLWYFLCDKCEIDNESWSEIKSDCLLNVTRQLNNYQLYFVIVLTNTAMTMVFYNSFSRLVQLPAPWRWQRFPNRK